MTAGTNTTVILPRSWGNFSNSFPFARSPSAAWASLREAMRLVGEVDNPRLVTNKTHVDHTVRMQQWAAGRLDDLENADLCGFVFKKDSPSSGLHRVKVYNDKGQPVKNGRGLFAAAFTRRFPRVPVEEEGRLNDPVLRENFIERVFAMKRWRELLEEKPTMGKLVDFHTREKLLLMSHSQTHYREMGRLVATGKSTPTGNAFQCLRSPVVQGSGPQGNHQKARQCAHAHPGVFQEAAGG